MPRPIKTDRNREVARSWVDGDTLEIIARRHGITRQCVQQILRLPVVADIVRPDEFVSVPTWVENADLRDDFIDVALAHDEYAAAAHCRALKREMAVSA